MKRSIFLKSFLSLFCILFSIRLFGDPGWRKMNLSGGTVLSMQSYPDSSRILLCCVQNDGLYRSANRAGSWTKIIFEPCFNIAVLSNGRAFVSGQDGLYRTSDYGDSWEKVISRATNQVFASEDGFIAADTTTGYYSGIKGPWIVSFDYGNNWQVWNNTQIDQKYPFNWANDGKRGSILFNETGQIFRTEKGYFYRSHRDSLTQWTLVDCDLFDYACIYLNTSTGKGDTLWGYAKSYDFHPMGGLAGGVYYCIDEGSTWTSISNKSTTSLEKSGSQLFIGTESGELYLYNLGTTINTLVGSFGGPITSIDIRKWASGEIIISTYGGIFKTINGGGDWIKSDAGIFSNQIIAVQVVPFNDKTERIIAATRYSGLFISDDGGWTWQLRIPEIYVVPGLLKKAPSNPNYIYAAGPYISYSKDKGSTWETLFPHVEELYYYGWYSRSVDLDVDPNNPSHIIVNYFDHSMDHYIRVHYLDGLTDVTGNWVWNAKIWHEDEFEQSVTNQFDTLNQCIWITKKGYSFENISPEIIGIDPDNDSIRHQIPLPNFGYSMNWIIIDSLVLYLASDTDPLWRSTNFGAVWSPVTLNLNELCRYNDQHIYGISTNFSWNADDSTVYLLHWGSGVLVSRDLGETWESLNDGLENLAAYQIEFSTLNPAVAYLATGDGLYIRGEISGIDQSPSSSLVPSTIKLHQNFPNPFNATTNIRYEISEKTFMNLSVFSVSGSHIQTLVNQSQPAGKYTVHWNAELLPSGIYFIRLESNDFAETKKCMLLK
ncbi:MAG: T9SS type A sorting domain-containing protein [Candidatus Marinimicrobia bacterium]|nr:T9SS type A sorting domain-containing protein [Candidatus Neomarinimicrobiota bacterium]MBL7067839.1 T9SS type A sorting domain-containing protein [Candidatus Neomarinimicrobiota bacterium]